MYIMTNVCHICAVEAQMLHTLVMMYIYNINCIDVNYISHDVFWSGYLEWWLDSTWHLVLFIQFILNSVSIAYIYYYLRGG